MSDELDFSKPEELQTVSGKNVRIFCTDGCKPYEALGAVEEPEGWKHAEWTIRGKYFVAGDSEYDLVRKPRRVTGWVNLYDLMGEPAPCFGDKVFRTQEEAKRSKVSRYTCLGQIPIDAEIQT